MIDKPMIDKHKEIGMNHQFEVYGAPYDLTLYLPQTNRKRPLPVAQRPLPFLAALAPLVVFALTSSILFL